MESWATRARWKCVFWRSWKNRLQSSLYQYLYALTRSILCDTYLFILVLKNSKLFSIPSKQKVKTCKNVSTRVKSVYTCLPWLIMSLRQAFVPPELKKVVSETWPTWRFLSALVMLSGSSTRCWRGRRRFLPMGRVAQYPCNNWKKVFTIFIRFNKSYQF